MGILTKLHFATSCALQLQKISDFSFLYLFDSNQLKLKKWKTTEFKLWLLTTDPECAKPVSREMTLPELSSRQLWDVPDTPESWSVWVRRPHTSETKPKPSEVSCH